jgi:hypothetical protein
MVPDLYKWKVFTLGCGKKANHCIAVACLIGGTLPEFIVSGTVVCGVLLGEFFRELLKRRGRGTLKVSK